MNRGKVDERSHQRNRTAVNEGEMTTLEEMFSAQKKGRDIGGLVEEIILGVKGTEAGKRRKRRNRAGACAFP